MLTLEHDRLVVRFPEIHPDATCTIEFQRTLRIPDDNRTHGLPPGLGKFPLKHVDDYAGRLPAAWQKRGGVFFPMHETEAMWLNFHSDYPFAVKIATGKINAVTGDAWTPELKGPSSLDALLRSMPVAAGHYGPRDSGARQDYVVLPDQPWLDGYCVGEGQIRQFVAMPQGSGYSVEEQLTGEALHGGLQIIVYPLKPEFYQPRPIVGGVVFACASASVDMESCRSLSDMGLAAGGLMYQTVHEDEYGLAKWDQSAHAKCFVHLLNSKQYEYVTGEAPPTPAPSAADYTTAGLPWFMEVGDAAALPGAPKLQQVDSVGTLAVKKGESVLPAEAPLPEVTNVIAVPISKV